MYTLEDHKSLRSLNSFGVDAEALHWATYEHADDLSALFDCMDTNQQWMVLSGGNNVLFTRNFDGTILHPTNQGIQIVDNNSQWATVRVQAGVEWDDLVAWAVEQGLGGIENLSLIPGYVGAAPVQNIGAYGAEAKDSIESVCCWLTDERRTIRLANEACHFGYRDSIFKHALRGKAIILSVDFKLSRQPAFHVRYGELSRTIDALGGMSLHHIREAVISIRRSKLPDPKELGNAGSFFKNPVVTRAVAEQLASRYPNMPQYPSGEGSVKLAAGWLIDQCGLKGTRHGNVGVHLHQALVLVNYGGTTGMEIIEFAHFVQQRVHELFGIAIDMEVNQI